MGSDFSALRKIHQEFTLNSYFTAFSLITPKSDWLWIDIKDRNIDEKVKEAKKRDIFNLVVENDQLTLGYFNVLDLNKDKKEKHEKVNEDIISSSIPLY